jgi:hypothetical protein
LALCQTAVGGFEVAAGATKEDVLRALGRPKYVVGSGNKETLGYDGVRIVLVDGVVVLGHGAGGTVVGDGQTPAAHAQDTESMRRRKGREERYLRELRQELLEEPAAECKRLGQELRKAEVAVHRLKRKSPGLAPIRPLASASRRERARYADRVKAYEELVAKIASDLQTAERDRDDVQALYNDAKDRRDEIAGCDAKELYDLLEKSAWKQPGLKVGYVGVVGYVTVLKRVDDSSSLWLCDSLPANGTVLAVGFAGTGDTLEEQELFPGVVEVVGLHDSPELGKTIFEVRPYVRDTSQEQQ